MRGHLWMIWRFGVQRWWRYEKARRSRMTIDFSAIFTEMELARIGEHFSPAPWEQSAVALGETPERGDGGA